jgi:hypothetical protein
MYLQLLPTVPKQKVTVADIYSAISKLAKTYFKIARRVD